MIPLIGPDNESILLYRHGYAARQGQGRSAAAVNAMRA